jgi:serine/threonine protein kinase/Tol biopolymer transport system component
MTLTSGTRLGSYEIVAPLGAGGMGEVYRAKDTRLGRDVAIKVLPGEFFEDEERRLRFEREARTLASLNHPGIAAIYSFEEIPGSSPSSSRHLLVMELVEGEGLDAKIAAGPLSLEESLSLARQIAEALEAAHEKGIVHRDLKPANVKVTPDGRVKLLDFGLAKAFEGERDSSKGGSGGGLTKSPTLTARATAAGMILGTAAYMSPEQARGKTVDKRADVWAFGCVLFEMLTGRRVFEGETLSDTLAAILRSEADLSLLPPGTPPRVASLLRRTLQKDPRQRLHDIADARLDLEEIAAATASGSSPFEERQTAPSSTVGRNGSAVSARGSRKSFYLAWGLAAAFAAAAGTLALRARTPASQPLLVRPLTDSGRDWFPAASPDGKLVAFVSDRDGRERIWLKQMPDGDERPLTSGPDDRPRFSPDGTSLLFVRREGAGSSLWRVGVLGGEPRRLVANATDGAYSCDGRRLAWAREKEEEGRQVWTLTVGLSDGGEPREVHRSTTVPFDWPAWSPDGKWIVCFPHTLGAAAAAGPILVASDGSALRDAGIGRTQELSSAVWFGVGREILLARASPILNLFEAAACTIERMNPDTGERSPVLESPNRVSAIDVLGPGRLVFDVNSNRVNLREVPAAGGGAPGPWLTRGLGMNRQPRYSPDGDWIVFAALRGGNVDVWSLQPRTGAVRRLTDSPAEDFDPALTPDGRHLIFRSDRSGHYEIWMANADGSEARQLTHDGVDAENATATPDGKWIVYSSADPKKFGIWKIRSDGREATMLFQGLVEWPEVSPDGQYALFTSARGTEDSAIKVVRISDGTLVPFSIRLGATTRRVEQIAGRARWRPDGKAIAFVSVDVKGRSGVFVQDFVPGRDTASTRRQLAGFDPDWATETFAISPDGKRICLAEWEQVSSIMTAEGVPGVDRARCAR